MSLGRVGELLGQLTAFRRRHDAPAGSPPTLVHVTHWKAGSQWIRHILEAAAPTPVIAPDLGEARLQCGLEPGGVYPCVFTTRHEFDALSKPSDTRHFVVIRDLRDTLISLYFSWLVSHPILTEENQRWRSRLQSLDRGAGLRAVMEEGLYYVALIQDSWVGTTSQLVRFEDLLQRDVSLLDAAVRRNGCWPLTRRAFAEIVEAHRFQRVTGRLPGDEDVSSHQRKGIAGDWRNYFDEPLKDAFKERYGQTLIRTGYETDLAW